MQDRQADVPHLCLPLIQTNIQRKNIKPTRTENRLNSRNIAIAQGVQEMLEITTNFFSDNSVQSISVFYFLIFCFLLFAAGSVR